MQQGVSHLAQRVTESSGEGRTALAVRSGAFAAAAGIGYFLGARAGYALQIPGGIAALWPPAGIMLALLVLTRRREWPAVIAGGWLGSLASDVYSGFPLTFAVSAASANLFESVVAAWVLVRVVGQQPLDTLRGLLTLVVGVTIGTNAITATGGATVLHFAGGMAWPTAWIAWWVGDGLGMLIVAPALLVWRSAALREAVVKRRMFAEAAILFVVLLAVGLVALGSPPQWTPQPGLYVVFPLLLWAALRFGPPGGAIATLFVAFLALWPASHGVGPFVERATTLHGAAWLSYSFLSVASVTALIPAAILEERRSAQARQADSEARYRAVVETATDAIVTIDANSRIEFANAAVGSILGYSPEELIGRDLTDLMAPELRDRHCRSLSRYIATGERHIPWRGVELTALHRDGREVPVEVSFGEMVQDGRHQFTGVLRDITERREAAAALRRAEDRMRFALEASGVGVWEIDFGTGSVRWSATHEALHGIPEGGFGGTLDSFLAAIHEEDRQALLAAIDQSKRDRTDANLLYRTRRPDGSVRWLRGLGRTFHSEDGTPLRAAGIGMDVTEQRRLESQYRQAQKMESIGLLAGGIAHDFNNLLAAIEGYGSLLKSSLDPGSQAQNDLDEILGAARRAASLTGQLLAFSRKQILRPSVLDLAEVVRSIEPLLRRLISEDIEIDVRVRDDLGHVRADLGQVEQVILNLAINARDAMPDGGMLLLDLANVELTEAYGRTHIEVAPGSYVMLAVTDTGSGMEPEALQRIFEPFFTTKPVGRGTGLGLATVYGIVKQSDGGLVVYSEPGHGTTFKVYFPRVDERVETLSEPSVDDTRAVSETILVVEDDEALRRLAHRILHERGYSVVAAPSPADAIEAAASLPAIDLLITDVVLPEMNGRALAERLAKSQPDLKVLFMSGYTDDAVVRRGVLHQETHFIQKPFRPSQLLRKIREILDATGAATGDSTPP
jgi:PAS domain S-box-containing protein